MSAWLRTVFLLSLLAVGGWSIQCCEYGDFESGWPYGWPSGCVKYDNCVEGDYCEFVFNRYDPAYPDGTYYGGCKRKDVKDASSVVFQREKTMEYKYYCGTDKCNNVDHNPLIDCKWPPKSQMKYYRSKLIWTDWNRPACYDGHNSDVECAACKADRTNPKGPMNYGCDELPLSYPTGTGRYYKAEWSYNKEGRRPAYVKCSGSNMCNNIILYAFKPGCPYGTWENETTQCFPTWRDYNAPCNVIPPTTPPINDNGGEQKTGGGGEQKTGGGGEQKTGGER